MFAPVESYPDPTKYIFNENISSIFEFLNQESGSLNLNEDHHDKLINYSSNVAYKQKKSEQKATVFKDPSTFSNNGLKTGGRTVKMTCSFIRKGKNNTVNGGREIKLEKEMCFHRDGTKNICRIFDT